MKKKKSNHAGELHVSIKKRRKPTNDDTQTGSITTPDQDKKKTESSTNRTALLGRQNKTTPTSNSPALGTSLI
jgi:hypothetical protein